MSESSDAMAAPPQPPLPPPPPPPGVVVGTAGSGRLGVRPARPKPTRDSRAEVRELLEQLLHRLSKQCSKLDGLFFLSHYRPVEPLIQDGPMCGLVALCMASKRLGKPITIEQSLEVARSKNYTYQGEMFSASDMGHLAAELCKCKHAISRGETKYDSVVNGLQQQKPILVPYDADGNNEPCLKRGHKAHWAVLSGVLKVVKSIDSDSVSILYDQDEKISNLYHSKEAVYDTSSSMTDSLYDFVYAKQGKSAHTKLWPLRELLESNENLVEVGDKILNDLTNFKVPNEGIDKSLCGAIVILEPN